MGFSSAFDDVIREIENVNPRECGGKLVEGRIKNDEGIGHCVDLKTDSFTRPFANRRRNWAGRKGGISEFIGQRMRFAFKVSRYRTAST